MRLNLRTAVCSLLFLGVAALSLTGYAGTGSDPATSGAGPIPVTLIMDETGPISVYGLPAQLTTRLAIKDINAHGGVLRRKLKLTDLDSQSSVAKYVVLARQVANSDAAVVMGAVLSSSMRAIRPIFDRANKLYFYPTLYGGGVCDKDMFSTGVVPTQQLAPALKYMVEKGLKKWYVVAANYSYGQISAQWVQHYAKVDGATIVGGSPKFYALTDSDYSNLIPKIQASGANLIVAILAGPAQANFYKQWTATGLNKTTKMVATTFGGGGEQVTLGEAGKGIYAPAPFLPTSHPSKNNRLVEMWKASGTKIAMSNIVSPVWNGWHLWAAAANKAGSVKPDKVIAELETGHVSYAGGPAGPVYMDGPSHQMVTPMSLWRDNGHGSFDLVKVLTNKAEPTFIQSKCNLIKHPNVNTQFTPSP